MVDSCTSGFRFPARMWQAVRRTIRLRGGLAPTLRAAAALVKEEGLSGLRGLIKRADDMGAYRTWVERYDTIDEGKRLTLRDCVNALEQRPLISLIVPVYNTPEKYLREMIDSVRDQVYPNWELCIADDASSMPHVAKVLHEYSQLDSRIKVVNRVANGHICEASNDAVNLATGCLIALLDHDDVLPAHALYMVALYSNRHPDAGMFYSDEDKLAPDGTRIQPYFKSDWNAMLMLGQNMFSHFGVFDADLLRAVGAFRLGLEGSQDHDLALRCAERLRADQIVHIPHILYHWRVIAGSTARDVAAKPYVREASLRAVREHLERQGRTARVEPLSEGASMLRVTFPLAEPKPLVSILIAANRDRDSLARCVKSVLGRTSYSHFEIVIAGNVPFDIGAASRVMPHGQIHDLLVVETHEALPRPTLINSAAARARGIVLCCLGADTEITSPDWLDVLCGYALLPEAGAVGASIWGNDDRLEQGGFLLGTANLADTFHASLPRGRRGYFGRAVLAQQVSAVSGSCLAVRKSLFNQVGGFNSKHVTSAYDDVNFCLELQLAGYQNIYVPYAQVCRSKSGAATLDILRVQQELAWMQERWKDKVENDAFFNPNLDQSHAMSFLLASPPRIGQFA